MPSLITRAHGNPATPRAHSHWPCEAEWGRKYNSHLPQLYTLLLTSLSSLLKDFPVAQIVKNLPMMQESRVQSLCWEDPLQKGMTIRSSSLAWRIPWTEKPGRLQFMGSLRVKHDWATNTRTHTFFYALLSITSCPNPPEDRLDLWVSCLNIF